MSFGWETWGSTLAKSQPKGTHRRAAYANFLSRIAPHTPTYTLHTHTHTHTNTHTLTHSLSPTHTHRHTTCLGTHTHGCLCTVHLIQSSAFASHPRSASPRQDHKSSWGSLKSTYICHYPSPGPGSLTAGKKLDGAEQVREHCIGMVPPYPRLMLFSFFFFLPCLSLSFTVSMPRSVFRCPSLSMSMSMFHVPFIPESSPIANLLAPWKPSLANQSLLPGRMIVRRVVLPCWARSHRLFHFLLGIFRGLKCFSLRTPDPWAVR